LLPVQAYLRDGDQSAGLLSRPRVGSAERLQPQPRQVRPRPPLPHRHQPPQPDHGSDLGRSSRASLGSDLSASRAAAMAAANIRLSLGGAAGSSGSSLELNNRLRRGARPGRAMPRMGVEGAGLYKAAAAAAAVGERQHGGQNIWRSRSEAGIPGNPAISLILISVNWGENPRVA
jgi:hypothetical protein